MASTEINQDSDLVYTSKLMARYCNMQSKIRDLYLYVKSKSEGIDAHFIETGDTYIDGIATIVKELTSKR